jgi:DNA-binding NtrC family response regulator
MYPEREDDAQGGALPEPGPVVLVVEDDVMVRMAISDHLRIRGYLVLEASSADEARALFDVGWPIDVVFSDVKMPEARNGIELALWIELNHPDVPVVLASAFEGSVRAAALACGNVRAFLSKPYDFAKVESLLRTLARDGTPKSED